MDKQAENNDITLEAVQLQKINKLLGMSRIDAALESELRRAFEDKFPSKPKIKFDQNGLIANLSQEEFRGILRVLHQKYDKTIEDVANKSQDDQFVYIRLLDSFEYLDRFSVGNKEELLNAALVFGKNVIENSNSNFKERIGDLMGVFDKYQYFPKDPTLHIVARAYIEGLLRRGNKNDKRKAQLKDVAREYVDKWVRKGVLTMKEDEDIIDAVTG